MSNLPVSPPGEPGAYSEKSTRELLGQNVVAVGMPNFERCFRAVVAREVDYACLPVENSLGGSIHENYDLMLRYDLTIVAEHEFRVKHCLLAKPGVKRGDIKFAISHAQALAQCDNYLRGLDITPVPVYDTAGSAKMILENKGLPDGCTPENTASIASDLAGRTYRLNCLDSGIEDDDSNFTRFLLLGRNGVSQFLNKKIPSKTSIVFTLPNTPGALYKALACFALRDIDFTKIESRPTSASLLSFLKFRSQAMGRKRRNQADLPRFRYCFYLDFLASELDESAQYALSHLREQADFCRTLGSYPAKSRLVGPVKEGAEELKLLTPGESLELSVQDAQDEEAHKLKVGIIGYGAFGQFIGRKIVEMNHHVSCIDPLDKSIEAVRDGVDFFQMFDMSNFLSELDVVLLAVPLIEFEDVISNLPLGLISGKLVVEVNPLNAHPKKVLLKCLPKDADIIISHPMFGQSRAGSEEGGIGGPQDPYSSASAWDGQPMVYERVRVVDVRRADTFLRVFEKSRCQMVEMNAEEHDERTADAEFVTHLIGRLLDKHLLPVTPVVSKEFAALCDVADLTSGDTFDFFYGMFKYNARAKEHLSTLRDNLAKVERQLAAKEAYLAASTDLRNSDRRQLIAECKSLLREAMMSENLGVKSSVEVDTSSSLSSSPGGNEIVQDESGSASNSPPSLLAATTATEIDKKK